MLTELNRKSATHMKNVIVSCDIHVILYILFSACLVYIWPCYAMSVILKLLWLNCLKSLISQFSTFVKELWLEENCALQFLEQVVQHLSGAGFIIVKHRIQFSVLSVFCCRSMCLWLHFRYFIWFEIATMHACMNTAN